jgi:hypothetical protein
MAIKSCGITGLGSGLRVEGLGKGGSLVAVVAFFVAGFGFAFACDIGFVLCAVVAFFATVFFAVVFFAVGFLAVGFVFAMIISPYKIKIK